MLLTTVVMAALFCSMQLKTVMNRLSASSFKMVQMFTEELCSLLADLLELYSSLFWKYLYPILAI
jgi:hypothetical protein